MFDIGNGSDIGWADILEYLENDPDTEVIFLYTEGIPEGRRFLDVARRVTRKKPIVAIKTGLSEAAKKAVASHTGSLAGEDVIYEAAFRQSNIVSADDCEELLDIAKILSIQEPPGGNRVAVLSFQAGPGIMITDICATRGLELPRFSGETREKLEELLPPMTIRSNPVDLAFARGDKTIHTIIKTVLEDSTIDSLIFFMLPHPILPFEELLHSMISMKEQYKKPIVICINTHQGDIQGVIDEFEVRGIPVYIRPERAAKALSGLTRYGKAIGKF